MAKSVQIFTAFPLLFTSILQSYERVVAQFGYENNIDKELTRTNGYRLLGVFKDIQLRSCLNDLKEISKLIEKSINNLNNLPNNYNEISRLDNDTINSAHRISGENSNSKEMKLFFEGISPNLNEYDRKFMRKLKEIIVWLYDELERSEISSFIIDFCKRKQSL